MLDWRTPTLSDVRLIKDYMDRAGAGASDSSAVNIYLLREKYNIKIAEKDGFLYRKYTGERIPGRHGCALPLGDGDLRSAIETLKEDRAANHKTLKLIYLTSDHCEKLRAAGYDPEFDTFAGNSDYMYTAEHLATLPGKKNRKKRNRVSHFESVYPECNIICRESVNEQFLNDMLAVEESWFLYQEERIDSTFVEREEIYDACKKWDDLGLIGIVIYNRDSEPIAMSIASEISPRYFDIHFEKCYDEYAQAGGFAFVNLQFATYLRDRHGAEWINREEDIGLEGLRRAKMSYNPDLLLEKYHCSIDLA